MEGIILFYEKQKAIEENAIIEDINHEEKKLKEVKKKAKRSNSTSREKTI